MNSLISKYFYVHSAQQRMEYLDCTHDNEKLKVYEQEVSKND